MGVLSVISTAAIGLFIVWALSRLIPLILHYRHVNKQMMKFPYRETHWLWGNIHQMGSPEGYLNFWNEMMLKHGRVFCAWFSFKSALFICHTDTFRQVLKETDTKPLEKFYKGYHSVEPWIGDGLLVSKGAKWERNRKLLTPAFHFDILRPYVKVYKECADICGNELKKLSDSCKGESVDICKQIGLCTLDVMLTCALSFKSDVQIKGHPYEKAVARLMELVLLRSMNPIYFIEFVWTMSSYGKEFQALCDYAHSVSGDIIKARQESLKKDPGSVKKKYLDFLDILLTAKDENGVGLTFQEIRDEVDTFLFEGHDTTKAALIWSVYCLAKYQDEQEQVYEEVSRVCGNKEQIEWEDLQQLTYLSLFFKEVVRMYPPAPQISRKITGPVVIDGIELPAGVQLEIPIHAIHHNPLVWEDPEKFDPLRFSPERFADHDPYSYVPFSAGSRNCIGQVFAVNEVKTVLCCLVKRFQFGFDAEHEDKIILQPLATLKSKNGIRVKITERQK